MLTELFVVCLGQLGLTLVSIVIYRFSSPKNETRFYLIRWTTLFNFVFVFLVLCNMWKECLQMPTGWFDELKVVFGNDFLKVIWEITFRVDARRLRALVIVACVIRPLYLLSSPEVAFDELIRQLVLLQVWATGALVTTNLSVMHF
jgi:hypothetical protein